MNSIIAEDVRLDPRVRYGTSPYKRVELTQAQTRMWNETRSRFLYQCPGFSHILYEMMLSTDANGKREIALFTDNPAIPVAATDGKHLILRPDTFFQYDLLERTFIIAHEIAHCMFGHCELNFAFSKRKEVRYPDGVTLPYDADLMNIAEDYVINDMLVSTRVGKFNPDWLHDPKLGTRDMSPLVVYRKLYESGKRGSGKRFDVCLDPGASKGERAEAAAAERNQAQWNMSIAAAIATAKAQGDNSADLARHFMEIIEPKVSWQDHIKSLFSRKVGAGGYDWRRADRRLITRDEPVFAPGRSGHGCNTVVVGVDTSGSIGDKQVSVFFSELAGILEDLKPKRLVIMWCDAEVKRVDEVEDACDLAEVRRKGAAGGGGTKFEPVFKEIADMGLECDALVYLTDGYGSFPAVGPDYPVIWGTISGDSVKYPFGDVVQIEI